MNHVCQNTNLDCYEKLAPYYEQLYGCIDPSETVRQWLILLDQLGVSPRNREVASLRLLDVGCGPGWHLEEWAAAGFTVEGIDSSRSMLKLAERRLHGNMVRNCSLNQADIRLGLDIPGGTAFDVAVSHFNFMNLFPPGEREPVFRTLARLVRPGGLWITDFSEPQDTLDAVIEDYDLGGVILRKTGQFNALSDCYEQKWEGSGIDFVERFWFNYVNQAESLALTTGWQLVRRVAWQPYSRTLPWLPPHADTEFFVDIYRRLPPGPTMRTHELQRLGDLPT